MKTVKKKITTAATIMSIAIMMIPANVYAGALKDSKFVKGWINLLNDATTVGLVIEAILIALLELIEFIKYQMADDNEKPKHVKSMKGILFVGILAVSVTGLAKVILSYFE